MPSVMASKQRPTKTPRAGRTQKGATGSPIPEGTPWLIIGLGNPGPKYANTRHNVGRMVLGELAGRQVPQASFATHKRTNTEVADVTIGPVGAGRKAILAYPRTYMNVSGGPVKALAEFYKIPAERLIVIYDDLERDPGDTQLRRGGGDKGHNGLKSISSSLGTKDYWRLSCGIGRPPGRMDPAAYVLKPFPKSEDADVAIMCADAADAVERVIITGQA